MLAMYPKFGGQVSALTGRFPVSACERGVLIGQAQIVVVKLPS